MTVVAKCLYETQSIPAAETSMYPAPANTRTIIDKHTLTNTTGAAITATVRLIPSGQTAAGGFAIMSAVSIAAGVSYTCPEIVGHVLNPGDFISILPSAVGLVGRASGREVS
jgi:hypothetical protein